MPYARPTLLQLRQQALQDINSADLSGVDGLLRRSVLRVMALVQAGFAYLHYDYQDWVARQAVPWSATDEFAAGWGALKGVTRKDATKASGTAVFSGVAGTVIPSGTVLTRADETLYATTSAVTLGAAGTATVAFTAVAAGSAGNADAGSKLYLSGALTGVNSAATSVAEIVGGADQEHLDDYKARYLAEYANPPQGGATSDYVQWAEEVAGVTRAWAAPNGYGAGTVVVYVMLDETQAAHDGFPQGTNGVASDEPRGVTATGDQLVVANHISPLRPVTALVYVVAPNAQAVNFVIDDVSPFTSTTQADITTALEDMFRRLGDPRGATLYPSDWDAAVRSVAGMKRFTVVAPAAPVTLPTGSLPVLGTLTATT
ncbi:baseplate J/gp47 family protein [Roseomonas elaeocarpi]|uniref:Baseplate J/gp47 family protein n=1 Tax=Roseomonas elaeocarpi TaxID=907779 RepID=A0ABV6JQM1_9PROT